MIEQGNRYFVRQTFIHPLTYEEIPAGKVFLISNYKDRARADTHFDAIATDRYRYLYDWNIEADKKKLLVAASQPPGYTIYSAVVAPGKKYRLNATVHTKVRHYVETTLRWARGGERIKCNIFLRHGELYAYLRWGLKEESIRLREMD